MGKTSKKILEEKYAGLERIGKFIDFEFKALTNFAFFNARREKGFIFSKIKGL